MNQIMNTKKQMIFLQHNIVVWLEQHIYDQSIHLKTKKVDI